MKCAIIDDEDFAIELLSNHLDLFPELEIIKTFTDPIQAYIELSKIQNLDVLFLDIDMPELSGIDLAMKLRKNVKYIIFTTAFSKYAVEAFGVKAFDFLLKPIEKTKFIETVQSILEHENEQTIKPNRNILIIKNNIKGKFTSINLDDLIVAYVVGHKLYFVTKEGNFETTDTLKNVEKYLANDSRFMRVHNANIINLEKIKSIEGNQIHMINKFIIPISERYKPIINKFINENSSGFRKS